MADDGIRSILNQGVQAIGNLVRAIASVFPSVQSTSTTATAGTNGAPPSQVQGYFLTLLPGTSTLVKVPYYLP